MTYSRKPAPAVAVTAQCNGLPVRMVISENFGGGSKVRGRWTWESCFPIRTFKTSRLHPPVYILEVRDDIAAGQSPWPWQNAVLT
jgi:hypothetical protein